MKTKLSTRSIVIAGMLGAIAIFLGATGIGIFPVPTPAGKATIMHVPAIIGGVIEGPIVGALVGLIFGIFSFTSATSVMASDPIVAILPRIFIGVVAYYVYYLSGKNKNWGSALAAIAGTLTNTIGFLGISVLRGYLPLKAAAFSVVTNAL
ncbi:MAG: ECF transporter S component, partial [Peptococcia bacterium]